MRQSLDAVFENGVFRPLTPPELPDGQHVRIEIEAPSQGNSDEVLDLAAQVYQGLSETQIEEIEKIALSRRAFFEERVL
jgi:predicted DNA-binding antitoxin AbrB/MazE fold protein